MKIGVVNESTILNRFVLHTLQSNIRRLALITRKTNIKLGIMKGGGTGKEPKTPSGTLKTSRSGPVKYIILSIFLIKTPSIVAIKF